MAMYKLAGQLVSTIREVLEELLLRVRDEKLGSL
jgi:hypothetical protein